MWPDRGGSALETLAHVQHYGGPTRLLDVTHEAMIATFFATEEKFDARNHRLDEDHDGRLFAFQTDGREIDLDAQWGSRQLPWGDPSSPVPRWQDDLPFVWQPPIALNARITAQQGAFLVGGLPGLPHGQNSRYRIPGAWQVGNMKTMPAADVRTMTSVSLWMKSLERRTQAGSAATYTLRIASSAKAEIRNHLLPEFGYRHGSMYPDYFGLATYGAGFAARSLT